ncbi:glycosyltransferase family 4 protein [Salinibacterium sp. GXW1014]|uniref:glycosyltransferase family 4 protein n=1 Tax=Salinibacterium sp. GXW1014 TaxID=3377838 RepID=UPI00383A3D3B
MHSPPPSGPRRSRLRRLSGTSRTGLVVAEALACGTPVAAFDRGAISEIVDESSGCLARPGDIDSLAHAMLAATRSAPRPRDLGRDG